VASLRSALFLHAEPAKEQSVQSRVLLSRTSSNLLSSACSAPQRTLRVTLPKRRSRAALGKTLKPLLPLQNPYFALLKKLLIIIPCYNEAASIGALLTEIKGTPLPEQFSADIAVVNDSSKDNTAEIALSHGVFVLDLPVNLGIGGAVQTGLLYAHEHEYDLAVQMDGDGQHPPGELHKLLQHQEISASNVVIGSRFVNKSAFKSSAIRKTGISYFHWLNRLLTGQHIYDSTSGFRLMDKVAIRIAVRHYPDEYPEPESLVIFSKHKLKVEEVPVEMRQRQGGVSSIRNFAMLYYCFKVTIAMLFSYIRKTNL
jgi:glycosyltransferase involved in cell wall biosynthesis